MIRVRIGLDGAGLLRSCRVEGHGLMGSRGLDPVCAAVSVLLRSALRVLSDRRGIVLRGAAPDRGRLWMEVDYSAEGRDYLSAAGAFLIEGLRSVSEAYPDHCGIECGIAIDNTKSALEGTENTLESAIENVIKNQRPGGGAGAEE